MHTLTLGSYGTDSTGTKLLIDALHNKWPSGKHVAMLSGKACPWVGSAINKTAKAGTFSQIKEYGHPDVYSFNGFPMDAALYSMEHHKDLLGFPQQFNMIVCGIRHKEVVGAELGFCSDVMASLIASKLYNVPAVVLCQENDNEKEGDIPDSVFNASSRVMGEILNGISPIPGQTLVINVPVMVHHGIINVPSDSYSEMLPRQNNPYARSKQTDLICLKQGFVTFTELVFQINALMGFGGK